MIDNRFGEMAQAPPPSPNGFFMMPVACVQASPLEWIYQRMYEEAAQANRQPEPRDLFTVMN